MHSILQNKIAIYKSVPPLAWWLILGTGISRFMSFACLPALAIIQLQQGTSAIMIGIAIGAGPFAGLIAGCVISACSDIVGRKIIIIISTFLWPIAFLFFTFNFNWVFFLSGNALLGLCCGIFEPTSQALLSDIVPVNRIVSIFHLRYFVINIGFGAGPFFGIFLTFYNPKLIFYIATILFAIYAICLAKKMAKVINNVKNRIIKNNCSFYININNVLKDKLFMLLLLGNISTTITYSQFGSTLLQYTYSINCNRYVYPLLLFTNAAGIIFLQIPFAILSEKMGTLEGMKMGGILICIGYVLMAISYFHILLAFLAILIITFGELLIAPVQNDVIHKIATRDKYGVYFGLHNLRQLGYSIGPIMGSFIMSILNFQIMFIIIAIFGFFASYCYKWINIEIQKNSKL